METITFCSYAIYYFKFLFSLTMSNSWMSTPQAISPSLAPSVFNLRPRLTHWTGVFDLYRLLTSDALRFFLLEKALFSEYSREFCLNWALVAVYERIPASSSSRSTGANVMGTGWTRAGFSTKSPSISLCGAAYWNVGRDFCYATGRCAA